MKIQTPRLKAFSLILILALMSVTPKNNAQAEGEDPSQAVAPIEDTNAATNPDPALENANSPSTDNQNTAAQSQTTSTADQILQADPQVDNSNAAERDEKILSRVKSFVKKLDANQRKGKQLSSKNIENAIRNEFMRRTDGGTGASWLKGKGNEADKAIAMDNLELFMTYAENLPWISNSKKQKNKKKDGKEAQEATLLAVKFVIDKYNHAGTDGRSPASVNTLSDAIGLSSTGKAELKRRQALTSRQIAGEYFSPIVVKKLDDYPKKFKASLTSAAGEFEKLAKLMVSTSSVKGAGAKSKKHGQ